MTGAPIGPFESAREAMNHPVVEAICQARRESNRRGTGEELCHRLLEEACTAAGVEIAAYDHRIILWLAGWEVEICAVIAGWVGRAYEAGRTAGLAEDRTEED